MPFLVFEGSEGVGKSTQLDLLAQRLCKEGQNVVITREPGGTDFAEKIRALFKEPVESGEHPTQWTELLLVAAARAQHLAMQIRPQLNSHTWILCDRFLDSSYVYQGIRGGIGFAPIRTIHEAFMLPEDLPDLTLCFDLSPEKSKERLQFRTASDPHDRLDSEGLDSFRLIQEGFLRVMHEQVSYPHGQVPQRILIDASHGRDDVAKRVWEALVTTDLLPTHTGHKEL